ncbi:MAG: hypothetical protein HY739_12940 [Desulfobacterales bacterium]|nr:hypothetical protein [Desulfobacterales bacterium]
MGVSFTGDWDRLSRNLDNMARRFKSDVGKRIGKNLMKIERKILDHMDKQDLGWDELDPEYAARKEKAGLDPDTLRATNTMYENITTDQPNELEGSVGVKRGVKTKDGEEITDIAIIHEQPDNDGTKIPARKLWEPTWNEVKDDVASDIMGVTIRTFKK